jgi:hypothetical protein
LLSWNEEINIKGPPNARNRYRADGYEDGAKDAAHARAEAIENGANGQSDDVGGDGRNGEHEVEAQLLSIAHQHVVVEFLVCALVPIHALFQQHRLYGSETEDDTGREEAIYDSGEDLDCVSSALGQMRCGLAYGFASTWAPRRRLSALRRERVSMCLGNPED